jgi:hypothetical protein
MTQVAVHAAGGPSAAAVRYIEAGRYEHLAPKTIKTLETALGWAPGSVQEVLLGNEPTIIDRAEADPLAKVLVELRTQMATAERLLAERTVTDNPVVSMRLDPDVWDRAKVTAGREKRTVNEVIADALTLYTEVMGDESE